MVADAVERGDLDELTRLVDGLCAARDWDALLELRDRCARAFERGKQLWPAAHHAEYRVALEAPGPWAARMLVEGAGRFALGPVSEVAASTHAWSELAPHAPPGPVAALAAHERVVRGDDLTGQPIAPVLDLPQRLQDWEPRYELAIYRSATADFPAPELLIPSEPITLPDSVERIGDEAACRALTDLARAWTTGSDGRAAAVAVQGGVAAALAALGVRRVTVAELSASDALAAMAWTAASGGAHGRRRGAAVGRFDAWLAAAVLTGLSDAWPLPADTLGAAIGSLRWFTWAAGGPATGWALRLAVEDPVRSRAWAVAATDSFES
jgi:hypothetical protein